MDGHEVAVILESTGTNKSRLRDVIHMRESASRSND